MDKNEGRKSMREKERIDIFHKSNNKSINPSGN